MKAVIQEFSELSDSRELLESKPYPAGVYFTYLLIAVIIIGIVWASVSEIDIVVKANGVVRPLEKVSTLSNISSGSIKELNYENGDFINEGDVLFRINAEGLNIRQDGIENEIIRIEGEVRLLDLFKSSIEENQNLFDIAEGDATENYYYKYQKYELDNARVNENINILKSKMTRTRKSFSEASEYLESILKDQDVFSGSNQDRELYQNYKSYKLKISEIRMSMEEAEKNYNTQKSLYDVGSLSKSEFDKTKLLYDQYKNQLEKYISDTKVSIKSQMENYSSNIIDYEGELSKLIPTTSSASDGDTNPSAFETETLIGLNTQLQDNKQSLRTLLENNESVTVNVEKTVIKAPISRRIDYVKEFAIGDYINAGTIIGTIVPKNGGNP